MIFIDASFYLALLNSQDSNHKKAISTGTQNTGEQYITSQAVLGEVLTVGSQRFDRLLSNSFVEEILKSNTRVVLEKKQLIDCAFKIFKKVKSKNVSWVDCYSFAIMENLKIDKALTFDKDFKRYFESK